MIKKITIILLAVIVFLSNGTKIINAVDDTDFASDESKYYSLCSQTGLSSDDKNTCKLFQQYLSTKAKNIQDQVQDTQNKINSIKGSISSVISTINALQAQIDELNSQISALQTQIDTINANITKLQTQIDERTLKIEELNNQIKSRMVDMQPFISLNKYIEFIMGATDFVDLIRRTSAINEIMDYDTKQIQEMEDEKTKLKADQDEMQEQKNSLTSQQDILNETKTSVDSAKASQEELVVEYQNQEAALEAAKRAATDDLSGLKDSIQKIADNIGYIAPSLGWIYPIEGSFYISAGTWYYAEGGVHLGLDFAASTSKYDVAVANGVIAYISDGYGWGNIGNWSGTPAGGGNTVTLICQVGGETYAIGYNHMSSGIKNYISVGQVVTQGTRLGKVGSSGNSSGPHTHIDLYYLGTISIQEALNLMSRRGLSFGAGWSLSGICGNKSAPCRLRPESIFNVSYGHSYSS